MVAHNSLELQLQESDTVCWPPWALVTNMVHIYVDIYNIQAHKMKLYKSLKKTNNIHPFEQQHVSEKKAPKAQMTMDYLLGAVSTLSALALRRQRQAGH